MQLLDGKIALITGAARGIGSAIAKTFIEFGAKAVIGDIDKSNIQEIETKINKAHPGSVVAAELDVGDMDSVSNFVDLAVNQFGKIDILVNNAGVHRSYAFLDFPMADFDLVYRVNVKGMLICSQLAARQMVRQGNGGCIISISSASGKKADQGGTAYNSSKSAMIGLNRIMALELGQYGIRANCVLPGATDTEMLRAVFEAEPSLKTILEERTPLGHIAVPRDQANTCVFLASDLAAHITGEQIVVSGGEYMN